MYGGLEMADTGVLGELHISGNWAQKRMILPVIMAALEMTSLASPAICPTLPYNKLKGTIPMLGNVPVASQLEEFEAPQVGSATPGSYDVELLKDRVTLAVSDEAMIESDVGSPMTLQQQQAAGALAANLNVLIAEKLDTTPQQYGNGNLGNWASAKPTLALGKMSAAMGIYRPTAFVMGTLAGEYYADTVGDKVAIQNLSEWRGAASIHPTLQIPVFMSTDIDNLDASGNTQVFAVCNKVPGVINVVGQIKARQYDDPKLGAEVYQYDIWRTPFSNLRQTTSSTNLGVMWGYMTES